MVCRDRDDRKHHRSERELLNPRRERVQGDEGAAEKRKCEEVGCQDRRHRPVARGCSREDLQAAPENKPGGDQQGKAADQLEQAAERIRRTAGGRHEVGAAIEAAQAALLTRNAAADLNGLSPLLPIRV